MEQTRDHGLECGRKGVVDRHAEVTCSEIEVVTCCMCEEHGRIVALLDNDVVKVVTAECESGDWSRWMVV